MRPAGWRTRGCDRRSDAACGHRHARSTGPHHGDRMKNFGDIQKLAQKMQADMAKAQEELGAMTVEGSAGGGAGVLVMTGTQEGREVLIKKEAVSAEEV